ncbi:MAG TPA: xylulokinase [Candidatus Hydrogenedentes bacterium]|nr:xylulokinase [Candidatus Hydrogenedentota bacterium]
MSIVLGLDVGTSGTKAIAMNEAGALLASATVEYPLHSPRPGWAEQDPAAWRRAAIEALSQLAARIDAREVKGVGLTGQMHGSVFLDADNEVLRPAILWCDQRTAKQCEDITSKVGEERLIEMVSNPALTGFTAPKILWLRENEPHHYERVRKVLLPKDYIRFALTGEFATDVADASGTLLFDVKNRCWHKELLSLLDIDPAFLPRAFEGPEVTGRLSTDAAAKTGLPAGIPVVAGGGDQAAGGVGCGIVRTGVLSSTLGTSGVTFAFADKVTMDPRGRVHTFCHAVPGKWHVMGVMLSAGGSLRWFRDALCQSEKAVAAETGADPYEYIAGAAARVPAGAEGLTFLPYLTGERTPHKDPYARGAFIGLSLRHTRAHMARAVLEGVAFGMRDSLEIIREMGVPIEEVRASGGGARSALWRQIQADINNVPLVRINVDEGPAYGAALLAMAGTGLCSSVEEACDATIRVVDICEPDAERARFYERCFKEYQAAYTALAPGFRRAAEIG